MSSPPNVYLNYYDIIVFCMCYMLSCVWNSVHTCLWESSVLWTKRLMSNLKQGNGNMQRNEEESPWKIACNKILSISFIIVWGWISNVKKNRMQCSLNMLSFTQNSFRKIVFFSLPCDLCVISLSPLWYFRFIAFKKSSSSDFYRKFENMQCILTFYYVSQHYCTDHSELSAWSWRETTIYLV